jgi:hypothetical protein
MIEAELGGRLFLATILARMSVSREDIFSIESYGQGRYSFEASEADNARDEHLEPDGLDIIFVGLFFLCAH